MNEENRGIELSIQNIVSWHLARNLIHGSDDKQQVLKLIQEVGELSDSVCKKTTPIDDIGDIIVVLVNIAVRHNLSLKECIDHAYEDIKDRRGKMLDGIFIKEEAVEVDGNK
jgi:NTP pyrophosphatase (non-canonical NTP hydrolase)